jgi:hypothetical protein
LFCFDGWNVAPLPVAAAAGSDGPGSSAAARAALCLLPCCHRRYRYMRCVCVLRCGARFHLLVRPVCCVSCHVPRSHKRDGIMGLVYQKGWDYEKGPLLVPVTPFFFRSIVYELPPMRRGPHLCSLRSHPSTVPHHLTVACRQSHRSLNLLNL